MKTFTVNIVDDTGVTEDITAASLEVISDELKLRGYDGPSLRAYDETGFVAGYVSSGDWKYV